jgi:hypothetical protein
MSGDAGTIEAIDRLIEQWAARIRRSSGTTVEAILMQAENVLGAISALRPHGPKARRLLQMRARLSQPMLSKLEAIGRHSGLMRLKVERLPPSVSSLYLLTREPWRQYLKAIEIDLRDMTRSEISRLRAHAPQPMAMRKLMTIKVPLDIGEAERLQLIKAIRSAVTQIAEDRGIELRTDAGSRDVKRRLNPAPIPAPPSCHRKGRI